MIAPAVQTPLSPVHQKALQRAFIHLEEQNFAARLADYAGQPLDRVLRAMPKAASRGLNRVIEAAIFAASTWRSARLIKPQRGRRRASFRP